MIKKGAVFGLAHDKGEKIGLGRLAQEIGCQNVGKNIDPLYDEGILSLRLNANGVVANDESIAEHIENSFVNVDPYLEDQEVVEISTYTTDSGGNGGTVEGHAIALTRYERQFIIWYIINCGMHGLSKPLQNAWERAFGKNGIQEVTMIQFLYCCWGVQDKLGENFKMYWKELESRGATREQLDSITALAGFKELLRVLVGAPDFNADIEVLHEDHDAQSILDTVA